MVISVRWLINRDYPQVLEIEEGCFEFPWLRVDFVRCLRDRDVTGLVAECNEEVVGYIIYECCKNYFHVLNLAVRSDFRGQGVGRGLVERIFKKLSVERRDRVLVEVRDGNLGAQLFLRSLGFKATKVLYNFYEDTEDDAYLFSYNLSSPVLA